MRVQVWQLAWVAMLMSSVAVALQPGTIEIDTQKWRDRPQRHLLIHGTLNGDTAFRLLMPAEEAWRGRIIQYLEGGLGGDEKVGSRIGHDSYALAHGAVYVESSQGHRGTAAYENDDTWEEIAYEASYAVVQYAQSRCVEVYGQPSTYVYVTGDSGGGHRSTGLLERFPELYDGAVPCVAAGTFRAPWYLFSVFEHSRPVLQPKQVQFSDACEPGAARDLWDVLTTPEEKTAMRRLLFAAYPMEMLGALRPESTTLLILDYDKYKLDPTYFEDFWSEEGYEGYAGSVDADIVEGVEGEVLAVNTGKNRLEVELDPVPDSVYGMTLTFTTGKLAGEWRRVYGQPQGRLQIGPVGPGIDGAAKGDRFVLDNRDLLAFRYLHNHIRDPEDPILAGLQEERDRSWAQRDPTVAKGIFEPNRPVGAIKGKVIAVYGTRDTLVWPSNALRYARLVRQRLGPETDDHFRLHFVENGVHHPMPQYRAAHFVGRLSLMHKALDDLMAWVEAEIAPPAGTAFTIDESNQLHLAESAEQRGGYQPVVSISADGQDTRLETAKVATVAFRVVAADPDNELVSCEIDFEGDGTYDERRRADSKKVDFTFHHSYDTPGTFFPTARVTDSTASIGSIGNGIQNLAAMRVVVAP